MIDLVTLMLTQIPTELRPHYKGSPSCRRLPAYGARPGARYITGQTIHANGGLYMG